MQEEQRTEPWWYRRDSRFNGPNQPVTGVSWYEAEAFCTWLTDHLRQTSEIGSQQEIRLPTEVEWERLARGSEGWEYPWGDEWQAGLANTKQSGLYRSSVVGLFPGGVSPAGALDCAGNVWEWCADWDDQDQGRRVVRGGAFFALALDARCAFRSWFSPDFGSDSFGFRVVVAPISTSAL